MVGALKELAKVQPLEFPQGIFGVSIGSILATALAYRIPPDAMQRLFQSVSLDDIAPSLRLPQILGAPKTKGLYSMDDFEQVLLKTFRSHGVDLEHATVSDAPQPLFLVASNLTRSTPTIFQGDVRLLDALKASCALPLYFQPQVIYDSVYVDGGLFTPSIQEILPEHLKKDALILNLSRPRRGIPPSQLESMTPWNYVERIYQASVEYRLKTSLTSNSVWLRNETVNTMDTLTADEQQALVDSGASQFVRFWTERLKKPPVDSLRPDPSLVVHNGFLRDENDRGERVHPVTR